MSKDAGRIEAVIPFDRAFFESTDLFSQIGAGALGGKATGLFEAVQILGRSFEDIPGVDVTIPRSVVIGTDVFKAFMHRNDLYEVALSEEADERIAIAFQQADFPAEHVGDLMALAIGTADRPLAVRSSSLLEDALAHPFAGIYQTKMVPNNQSSATARFRSLLEAVKFVYASTFFRGAREYISAVGKDPRHERMAVMIQEVVGRRFGSRFYPEVSGVCRSYNYYRTGRARPGEGVVTLALGLGKTIMDGGVSMSYSPAHPKARLPFANTRDMLGGTQLSFWAVHMGPPPSYDPTRETEYLAEGSLADAEADGSLVHVASSYDAQNDRVTPGVHGKAPRVIDFAPLIRYEKWPVNSVALQLLDVFRRETGHAVEIEFVVTFGQDTRQPAKLVVLQVRPMKVSQELIGIARPAPDDPRLVIYSTRVMGNGSVPDIRDIIYVRRDRYEGRLTRDMARDLEGVNRRLRTEGIQYLLIGLGRWGSSDPWLGIPVTWGQISSAGAIVESTLPGMSIEPSQGAHFFLNIESFRVPYFTVPHEARPPIDWTWIEKQPIIEQTATICHARCDRPLVIRVDGRTGCGDIRYHEPEETEPEDEVER